MYYFIKCIWLPVQPSPLLLCCRHTPGYATPTSMRFAPDATYKQVQLTVLQALTILTLTLEAALGPSSGAPRPSPPIDVMLPPTSQLRTATVHVAQSVH